MLTAIVLAGLACLLWPGTSSVACSAPPPETTTADRPVEVQEPRPNGRADEASRWVRRHVRGSPSGGSAWVADFAEVVVVGLDAGLGLGSAVVASARSPGVLDHAPWLHVRLVESVAAGRGVSGCLEPPSGVGPQDRHDLALLAAAWRLVEEVGARASDVTRAAAEAVRSRRADHERATVLAAGPRASMWLLTALPLAGPVAGAVVGLAPDRLYAGGAARGAALAGLLLTCGGWWWSQRLLARARRPGRTSGRPR